MPQAPSLSEITGVRGDASLAYGTQGQGGSDVAFDFNKGLSFLSDAASKRQQANQFKVELFQKNLENFYKNFNDLSVDGVMEKDYPAITQEYAALTRDLAENYDVIRNPMKDPQRFAQLQQREAALRSKISASKQDLAFRKFNQDFINTHKEFNTDENRQMIEGFTNSELGSRSHNNLRTPNEYNPLTIAQKAREYATQTLTTKKAKGMYFDEEGEKKVKRDAYMEYWRGAHNAQDTYGRSGFELAKHAYDNTVPADRKSGMDFNTWLDKTGEQLMGDDLIEKSSAQSANPVAMQDDQQRFTAGENAKDRAQRAAEYNRTYEANYGKNPRPEDLGRMKNEAWTMAFTTGKPNLQMMQNVYGNADKVNIETEEMIPNPDPATNSWVKTIKTGKKTTVPVDRVQVTGTELDGDGNLVVKRVDNAAGGKAMPDLVVKQRDAYVDFNRILGDKFAVQTDEGSRKYMENKIIDPQSKKGIRNPDINTFRNHFQVDANGNTIKSGNGGTATNVFHAK